MTRRHMKSAIRPQPIRLGQKFGVSVLLFGVGYGMAAYVHGDYVADLEKQMKQALAEWNESRD
ncbi:unnamed protein product [Eruca vesicaria subsp. sativa]|uniref:Uncharacterized protein n=1 Tax=Eruca vesicaria subsp. sativa TaxID=29727 RepID=A0ABC8KBL8_ERUVS|nr:unnamed protein product [Eruca vesicaria subsp. sativa]